MNAPLFDTALFRQLTSGITELAARELECTAEEPQFTGLTRDAVRARFEEPLPRQGMAAAELLEILARDYAAEAQRLHHPRYIGHQVAPPVPVATAVDLLTSTLNNGLAVWEMSPTGTMVEHAVLGWFAELLGWPAGFGGSFVTGGAVGNLTALAAARAHLWPDAWRAGVGARSGVIVTSEAAHYCIERAAGLLGLGSEAAIGVSTHAGRMVPEAADRALARAADEGRSVLALVATAGTTALGALDPLDELGAVAAAHGVWFHVDAAHAGSLLLSERFRPKLHGLERADSLAIDLHKMMFQPISTALVLCRERARLAAAFAQSAPYLLRDDAQEGYDLGGLTLQCSRRADALRAWATLKLHGAAAIAALQDRTIETTQTAAALIASAADFELLHQPETNILCFRHVPEPLAGDPAALDHHNDHVRDRLRAERFAYLTGTTLESRRVLRFTFMNPRTEHTHVAQVLDRIRSYGWS
ncbi:MAG: pyridoxal-dependent decarboxylase [Planctomycetota bacterium]